MANYVEDNLGNFTGCLVRGHEKTLKFRPYRESDLIRGIVIGDSIQISEDYFNRYHISGSFDERFIRRFKRLLPFFEEEHMTAGDETSIELYVRGKKLSELRFKVASEKITAEQFSWFASVISVTVCEIAKQSNPIFEYFDSVWLNNAMANGHTPVFELTQAKEHIFGVGFDTPFEYKTVEGERVLYFNESTYIEEWEDDRMIVGYVIVSGFPVHMNEKLYLFKPVPRTPNFVSENAIFAYEIYRAPEKDIRNCKRLTVLDLEDLPTIIAQYRGEDNG